MGGGLFFVLQKDLTESAPHSGTQQQKMGEVLLFFFFFLKYFFTSSISPLFICKIRISLIQFHAIKYIFTCKSSICSNSLFSVVILVSYPSDFQSVICSKLPTKGKKIILSFLSFLSKSDRKNLSFSNS